MELKRYLDSPVEEETELPTVFLRKLPLWARLVRWWRDCIS